MAKLYVYGTLRLFERPPIWVKGGMWNMGWYPAVVLGEGLGLVAVEPREIADITEFDDYEGYDPENEANSLYIRKPFLDGWIYEYNVESPKQLHNRERIKSGSWATHIKEMVQKGEV